jgi:uncharacterized protein (DUF983 family)
LALYLTVAGKMWTVERRHEMTQLELPHKRRKRSLYLFFRSPEGEIRRSEIAEDFPLEPGPQLLEEVLRNAEVLRAGSPGEMTSRGAIVMPRIRDLALYFWRALRLSCPRCGGRGILKSWFKLQEVCPTCGIRLERGEEHDYYLGGMFFNIVLAEGLFAVVFTVWIVVVWPDVPWNRVQYTLLAAMIAAPIVLYPVSRIMWLALDLLVRPVDDAEMKWHASEAKSARQRRPEAP